MLISDINTLKKKRQKLFFTTFYNSYKQKKHYNLHSFAFASLAFFSVVMFDSLAHTSGILSKNIFEMGFLGILLGNLIRIKKYEK